MHREAQSPSDQATAGRLWEIEPGQTIVYHVGLGLSSVPASQRAAWELHVLGRVELVQKKLGPGQFQYRAVGRTRAWG